MKKIYIIDSSSLINIKNKYPITSEQKPWNGINELCRKKRLIAPREVYEEIKEGKDELPKWAKEYGTFIDLKPNERKRLKEILEQYPDLIDISKKEPYADPWLIVLALKVIDDNKNPLFSENIEVIVVCDESKIREKRVSSACLKLGIKCINSDEFLVSEGLI